ncbi:MAG: ABC transporter substrate-binding protein, partial [Bdellovibrionota bacterium]|nr:ABC transporter substrate-binding protein [Bdellovibrionota bacterium]
MKLCFILFFTISFNLFASPRVISLELSFVEALVGLGISPVGISDDGDPKRILVPLREKMKPYKSVGTRKQPNLELMASLKPTLILADQKRHLHAKKQLNKIAHTLFLPSLGENYFSQIEAFEKIASALGMEEKFKKRMKKHKDILQNFRNTFKKWKGQKILFGVSWEKGVHIHTLKGFVPSLFEHVGLEYKLTESPFKKTSE